MTNSNIAITHLLNILNQNEQIQERIFDAIVWTRNSEFCRVTVTHKKASTEYKTHQNFEGELKRLHIPVP